MQQEELQLFLLFCHIQSDSRRKTFHLTVKVPDFIYSSISSIPSPDEGLSVLYPLGSSRSATCKIKSVLLWYEFPVQQMSSLLRLMVAVYQQWLNRQWIRGTEVSYNPFWLTEWKRTWQQYKPVVVGLYCYCHHLGNGSSTMIGCDWNACCQCYSFPTHDKAHPAITFGDVVLIVNPFAATRHIIRTGSFFLQVRNR